MGAAASRGGTTLDNPFPVSGTLSRDLDKLSMVAARILSTPDIYDVNNLARPGVCGDYAVFLKKDIEKQLLPFVADISGEPMLVAYQNPRRIIEKSETRKEICSQLATTMITAITTVVAALASIQVAWQPSREAAVVAALAPQRGGAITEVTDWLATNGYIRPIPGGTEIIGKPVELINRRATGTARPTFQLVFGAAQDGMHPAALSATGGSPPMPTGTLKMNFIKPIQITLPGTTKSILPFRISDNSGLAWMVGVLYEDMFQTLAASNTRAPVDPFQVWEFLFRRTQGYTGELHDTRTQLNEANEVFNQYRRTKNPQVILTALARFLTERIPGYHAGYVPGAPAGGAGAYMPGPYGYTPWAPPAAPGAYGMAPAPIQPLAFAPPRPASLAGIGMAPPAGAPPSIALRPAGAYDPAGIQYDIPLAATKTIIDSFKGFRDLMARQSSPAATRAITLSTKVNADRSIQTNICRDPYWIGTDSNLSRVYPWATLQFLSITDWSKLSKEARMADSVLMPEWRKFIDDLDRLYSSAGLKLTRTVPGAYFLDQMRVTDTDKLRVCAEGRAGSVPFAPIQAALEKIQAAYTAHVAAMWGILNSLIVVIADPAKKTEVVRLHPDVFGGNVKSSKKYVEEKAAQARKLIADFYLDVERIYVETIKSL
jgi:hypothetical protein